MPDPALTSCLVAVIGGGAAGLAAAISAADATAGAEPGAVVILEKQDRVGRKLLATGNGQCNLGNQRAGRDPSFYHGQDSRFADPALRLFNEASAGPFFRRLGLLVQEEPDGRIYPYSHQASAVLDILRLAAKQRGIVTMTSFAADRLEPLPGQEGKTAFLVSSEGGQSVRAACAILASGGLAAPSLGADGSGFKIASRLGHRMVDCFPALVPVRTETDFVHGLAGLKFEGIATVECGGRRLESAEGEILLTEYGLSGPPILQLSRRVAELTLKDKGAAVFIVLDMLPGMPRGELLEWLLYRQKIDPGLELSDFLTGIISKKIGQAVLKRCINQPLNHPASGLGEKDLFRIAESLKAWPVKAAGTRDWHQAQVTAGGLDVRDFDPDTMESRRVPGFFAAGEVLDIDGDCGGFNLQWAWASGSLAGRQAMRAAEGRLSRS
jgi:predicted Rossmann fold flavoprotein